MTFMVHVIGHLSDFLELLPLEPGGPELHRIASKLEEIQQGKSNNTAFKSEIVDIL